MLNFYHSPQPSSDLPTRNIRICYGIWANAPDKDWKLRNLQFLVSRTVFATFISHVTYIHVIFPRISCSFIHGTLNHSSKSDEKFGKSAFSSEKLWILPIFFRTNDIFMQESCMIKKAQSTPGKIHVLTFSRGSYNSVFVARKKAFKNISRQESSYFGS